MKKKLKKFLYFFLYYSGIGEILLKVLTWIRQDYPCIILLYHRIVDNNSEYLDKGPVVHHTIHNFIEEIQYIKINYQILSMNEVVTQIQAGQGFDRPTVAITFDDGYLDNYSLAYPVLKKNGVPATIYLTTSLIGTDERTWTDQIEYALLATTNNQFSMPELFGAQVMDIQTQQERRQVCIQLGEALKMLPDLRRKEILQNILFALGMNGNNPSESRPRMMLNWDEVREMSHNGITFGSHSHTHPILSRMTLQDAYEDILISKRTIEEQLGCEVRHFAYPNGRKEDFSEELEEYCRHVGFDSVASVIYGTNRPESGNAFSLKRIGAVSPPWMFAGDLLKLFLRSR